MFLLYLVVVFLHLDNKRDISRKKPWAQIREGGGAYKRGNDKIKNCTRRLFTGEGRGDLYIVFYGILFLVATVTLLRFFLPLSHFFVVFLATDSNFMSRPLLVLESKVQSCKLYNYKYMIASTQITNTENFTFIALLASNLLSSKVLFINRKDNKNC